MTPTPDRRPVAEEIGQRKPFPSRAQEAMVTLLRTTDVARRFLSGVLAPEDVTLQQYNVLRILRGAGPDGLPTLEIGRRMLEQQPGVTRLVDRLVAKELAHRVRDTEDRRRVVCTISEDGLHLLARMDRTMADADEVVKAALSEDEMDRLTELLDQLRAGLARAQASSSSD